MAINLAEKYSSQIDEVITKASLTQNSVNKDYDFVGAQTVKVYSFGTAQMNDYKTTGANRYGTPEELEDNLQEMTMTRKRSFTFTIDKTHAADSPEGVRDAAKALQRQIDMKVMPEIDAYRLCKMADKGGNKIYTTITKSNAYETFLSANALISDKEMPTEGRIAHVSPEFYKLIKLDNGFIRACDISQEMLIKGQVGEVDGVAIIMTPSVRLPAGASFVITNSIATTSPVKLAEYKIHEDPPGLAGHLVEGLVYYDAFVLNNKKNAIAVCYGAPSTIKASMTAGASGKGTVTVTGITAGGTLVYKTGASQTAASLGDNVSSWETLPANGLISATSSHKLAVAVKDADGKAIATADVITVAVGG